MNELQTLTTQREELLTKIREIEESCEGIENEHNAQRVQELNLEHAQLSAQKQELSAKLSAMESKLSAISSEITKLSGTGVERILEAIKSQRWYFFKNKIKLMFDKNTGILLPNLNYYNIGTGGIWEQCTGRCSSDPSIDFIKILKIDGINNWRLPTKNIVQDIFSTNDFPFYYNIQSNHCISTNRNSSNWYIYALRISSETSYRCLSIDLKNTTDFSYGNWDCGVLPCSTALIDGTNYARNIFNGNPNYTEKERLQFTLDLFVQNDLWPIFNNAEITELYKKIYYEKPRLLEQLQELQTQIESLQTVVLLSSTFDYTALLAKYNIKAIDASIIQYYQAVQNWTEELLGKLDDYEREKEDVIQAVNEIGLELGKKCENCDSLSEEENALFQNRQRYFASQFSIGMNHVKAKLLAVKHQADALEARIDEIDNGDDAIRELALLEKEDRASFSFLAENTAKIIRNALKKIEFFEANQQYVLWVSHALEEWTEKYKGFKTTQREALKNACESDGIEEEIWQKWYADWQSLRFKIEQNVQPIMEKELHESMEMMEEDEITVAQQVISELAVYRNAVDSFYLNERKGIHQKFVSQEDGALQDKLETESRLYEIASEFQRTLRNIIFNCAKVEDRIFILNWVNDLLDISLDKILALVSGHDSKQISDTILAEFSELKKKNYDIYLADAKSYEEEQARRNEQFHSLLLEIREGVK